MSPDSKISVNLWNCLGGSVLCPQDFRVIFQFFHVYIFEFLNCVKLFLLFNLFQFVKV